MARSTPPARTLNLKNPEVYRLASELAAVTGESMTEAVRLSLEERLDRVTRRRDVEVEPGSGASTSSPRKSADGSLRGSPCRSSTSRCTTRTDFRDGHGHLPNRSDPVRR